MVVKRFRQLARSRTSRGFRLVVPWLLGLLLLQALLTLSLEIVGWDDTGWLLGIVTGRGILVAAVVVLVVMTVRLCLHRFQFRLRTLLLAMTVLSVLFALFGTELLNARKEQQAAIEIQNLGGSVLQDENTDGLLFFLRWIIGEDYFPPVFQVCLKNDRGLREGLEHFDQMPSIEFFRISGAQVTDEGIAGLVQLERLPHVDNLMLDDTFNVSDAGLATIGNLSHVKWLNMQNVAVTDAGLSHLGKMKGLELIAIYHDGRRGISGITDAGLAHLCELTNLQSFYLDGSPVTDAGLVHLQGMKNLRHLSLRNSKVTREGIECLQRSLPNCTIDRELLALGPEVLLQRTFASRRGTRQNAAESNTTPTPPPPPKKWPVNKSPSTAGPSPTPRRRRASSCF